MRDVDDSPLAPILALLSESFGIGGWQKCVFSHPDPGDGAGPHWEKLTAEPVRLARGVAVKLVSANRGRQSTLTVLAEQWPRALEDVLARNPHHINLLARDHDWHARLSKGGRWLVSRGKPSLAPKLPAGELPGHDRTHHHPLPGDDPEARRLFIETGLFGFNGVLRGESSAKYRQVQHYLELLRPLALWDELREAGSPLHVVDAGCGKAYLSLALYLFARRQGLDVQLTGIDRNPDVVDSVAASARRLGYEGAEFHAQDIAAFAAQAGCAADLLVSLHACDTATDEAIAAGVTLGARAIVLAPCCHRELVTQFDDRLKAGVPLAHGAWAPALDHGLLRHRLADIVTDALRASALEALGYRTAVLEFVSPEHTARNLMIRAELRPPGPERAAAGAKGLAAYEALASEWQVDPAVRRLLGDGWPGLSEARGKA